MPLSWNEIRHRAIAFSKDWTAEKRERAEKHTFWNEFFNVFGVSRRAVASFEEPVRGLSGDYGWIDLLWPGVVLVEHKSRGKDLGKAESQAFRYIQDLARERRDKEIPRTSSSPTSPASRSTIWNPTINGITRSSIITPFSTSNSRSGRIFSKMVAHTEILS